MIRWEMGCRRAGQQLQGNERLGEEAVREGDPVTEEEERVMRIAYRGWSDRNGVGLRKIADK